MPDAEQVAEPQEAAAEAGKGEAAEAKADVATPAPAAKAGEREAGGAERKGAASPAELLASCADGQLLSSFSALVGVLPREAQARCLAAVREALAKEVEASLKQDPAGEALWRRLLGQSPVDASAPKQAKRPVRAMAMPFVTAAPAAKRLKEAAPERGAERQPEAVAAAAPGEAGEAQEPGPREEPSLRVYMSNIAYQVNDARLRTFFAEKCKDAQLLELSLLRTPAGKSKGAALVTFSKREDVERALALNGEVLEDRVLTVREDRSAGAQPKGQGKGGGKGEGRPSAFAVIVKNLGFNAKEANLGELFAGCGEIVAARIAKDRRSGRSKGFAVVEFSHAGAVQKALERSGREVSGRAVRVEVMRGSTPAAAEEPGAEAEAGGSKAPAKDAAPAAASKTEEQEEGEDEEDEDASPALTSGDKFAMALDDLDALNDENSAQQRASAAEPPKKDSLQAHARKLVAEAAKLAATTPVYPTGDEGLKLAASLAERHGSADALLTAEGPDALKERLAALGLKAGGTPLQRAERLLQLKGLTALDQVAKELVGKRPSASAGGAAPPPPREPIKFVKAGAEDA